MCSIALVMSPPGAFIKRDGHDPPSLVPTKASKLSSLKKRLSKMNLFDRRASDSPPASTPDPPSTPQETPWQQPGPVLVTEASLAPIPGVAPALFAEPTLIPRTPRNDSANDSAPIETSTTNEDMPARPDSGSAPSSTTIANSPPPSPTMKKASPMPLPAYPTPSSPWHHTNGQNGGTPEPTPSSAGKTSQVLAKLTSDNDRLRREIKAEKAAKEEALQQYQLLKGRVNRLEEQNGTIQMQFDHNESALARKERRLDDLRLTLDEETARRKRAEEREAEMGRKLGETVSQAAQDVAEAHNAQRASEAAYDTLKREYTGLEKRIQHLRDEVKTAVESIDAEKAVHRKQLTQLEVLLDQERHIQEKSNKDVREMALLLQSYRATEENVKRLETEMQNTVHEMRWVMRLHEARQPTQSPAKETGIRRPPAA